jgi:hypothetical protein
MKVSEKLPYAIRHVESIGSHKDEDSAVRLAALEAIKAACDAQAASINAEIQARLEALG